MFKLILQDRKGNSLNEGDIVKISDGRWFHFYAEVKYLEKEKKIAPFHTFSFHSFEKVDKLPETAVKCEEPRYGIWHLPEIEKDCESVTFEKYLIDWRTCESELEKSCFRIERINQTTLF